MGPLRSRTFPPHSGNHLARGMILGVTDNLDASAIRENLLTLRNSFGCVICSFGVNFGLDLSNEPRYISFGEDHNSVDIGESGNNFRAFCHRGYRAPLTF